MTNRRARPRDGAVMVLCITMTEGADAKAAARNARFGWLQPSCGLTLIADTHCFLGKSDNARTEPLRPNRF